jgi:hypothetical protein
MAWPRCRKCKRLIRLDGDHWAHLFVSDHDALGYCLVCGPQEPLILHTICHPDPPMKLGGCGHPIKQHSKQLICKVCKHDCGVYVR